jgi:thymidylate kinase
MYLILIGCEYAGTTTLANAINEWTNESLGTEFKLIHDHFKLPDTKPHGPELTADDIAAFQRLSPRLTEVIQRHNLYYHTPWASGSDENFMGIGLYFEELVYAPHYYGYGGRGEGGDRGVISRLLEQRILQFRPDAVLVLVEAAPDVIRKRMAASPHPYPVVPEEDVAHIIQRFEEEFENSLIRQSFRLDTSTATVAESVAEFAAKIQPYLTEGDLLRLSLQQGKAG